MWFSYPMTENWIPLPLSRVKEIQQMNKEGVLPPDLGEIVEVETKPVKVLDYENVVGQDSLTRLDDSRNRNKNKTRNKNHRQNGPGDNNRPQQQAGQNQGPKPAAQQGPRVEGGNPNKKRKFRPNRNQNRPDNRGGGGNPGNQ